MSEPLSDLDAGWDEEIDADLDRIAALGKRVARLGREIAVLAREVERALGPAEDEAPDFGTRHPEAKENDE